MSFKLVVHHLPSVLKRSTTNPYLPGKMLWHEILEKKKKKESHWELNWVTGLNIRVTGSPVVSSLFHLCAPFKHKWEKHMQPALAGTVRPPLPHGSINHLHFPLPPKVWVKRLIWVFHTGPFHYHSENSEELRPPRNSNGRSCWSQISEQGVEGGNGPVI